jgi:hypothetical protein
MHGSIQRRLSVAMNWSVARIASLDARERYEDSYALTQEFREWILCLDDQPELLAESVLMVPRALPSDPTADRPTGDGIRDWRGREPDGRIEI